MQVWTKSAAAFALLTVSLVPSAAHAAPAPARDALSALAATPHGPLPPGTRLLSVVLNNGLATTNFSHQLRDNFAGGDTQEARTVSAVLKALGRFPTVARVQILVDGKPIDTLGGLLVLSAPLPVIRPAAPVSVPPAADAPAPSDALRLSRA